MTVSEHLMRPGTGTVSLAASVPVTITTEIRTAIDERSGGPGAHIVITPTHMPVTDVDLTGLLNTALWTGRITASKSRTSYDLDGLGTWLDSAVPGMVGWTGSPYAWVAGVVRNGLTVGADKGGGNGVARDFAPYSCSWREVLDTVAALGGFEYEIRPNFTVDFGARQNLFRVAGANGTVVVEATSGGVAPGQWRSVSGSLLDQEITSLDNIATDVVVLGQGAGQTIQYGYATKAVSLRTWSGAAPQLVATCNAPSEQGANLNTTAQNFLNLTGPRRKVHVASDTPGVRRFVRPGDEIYAWNLETGLVATTGDVIEYRGLSIAPIKLRVISMTWPIDSTYGVYAFINGTTRVIDLTTWATESSTSARWTVGDWSPAVAGPVNRRDPMIEQRAS